MEKKNIFIMLILFIAVLFAGCSTDGEFEKNLSVVEDDLGETAQNEVQNRQNVRDTQSQVEINESSMAGEQSPKDGKDMGRPEMPENGSMGDMGRSAGEIPTDQMQRGDGMVPLNKVDGMRLPPEALEACIDLNENDVCSFTTPRDEEMEGTCTLLEDALICNSN